MGAIRPSILDDVELSDEWQAECVDGRKAVVALSKPAADGAQFAGWVTVDFEQRLFAGGLAVPQGVSIASTAKYGGRGWKQQIVTDAIVWLDGLRK